MTEDVELSEVENVDTAPAEDIEEGQNVEVFINLYV
jgi:hypothetical protein